MRNAAEGIAESLGLMTPQQKARLQQWLERSAAEYAALTTLQKQAILTHMADTVDRLRSMPPEQKAKIKALYQQAPRPLVTTARVRPPAPTCRTNRQPPILSAG